MSAHGYTITPAIFARWQRHAQLVASAAHDLVAVLMNDSKRRSCKCYARSRQTSPT
jgi:hypothetical protein